MRSFAISFAATVLAFICGIVTASSWTRNHRRAQNLEPTVIERCPQKISPPAPVVTPATRGDVVFGDGLLLVPEEAKLKSEYHRYDITLRYPQVAGSNEAHFRKLNQHLKQLATEQYQRMLNPSKAQLQHYQEAWPGTFNKFTMDYDVHLANHTILSIYLYGYEYGIGSDQSTQYTYGVNYDLITGKKLKLSDIFKPGSYYLEFISSYCQTEISKKYGPSVVSNPGLAPRPENFETWNLTRKGITLNFDACKLFTCTHSNETVDIPFSAIADLLTLEASNLSRPIIVNKWP